MNVFYIFLPGKQNHLIIGTNPGALRRMPAEGKDFMTKRFLQNCYGAVWEGEDVRFISVILVVSFLIVAVSACSTGSCRLPYLTGVDSEII